MKKLLILLILLTGISVQESFSQKMKLNKADKKLNLFDFDKSVETYEKVLEKNPSNFEAIHGLANAYRIRGDYATAVGWYEQVVADTANVSPKDYLHYGQCLRFVRDYEKAQQNFIKYAELAPEDPRSKLLNVSYEEVKQLIKDSLYFGVQFLDFNDESQEFSPAFYKDSSIVFPSSRNEGSKIDDYWYNKPFFDLYISEMSDSGHAKPKRLDSDVNNRYHEGPLAFDTSFTTMYFTRNNYVKRKKETGEENIMRLKIFSAKSSGDSSNVSWGNLKELPFNSDEYSCGHPTLTQDGKMLYFSSDMPGGYGTLDLYSVEIDSNGRFGEPKNLGPEINTAGEESFPYIHPDGTLYFASDARKGLGGLDVYYSKKENTAWSEPVNMNYPINTNADDFGLIMRKDKKTGYLSSNRGGDFDNDNILSFDDKGMLLKGFVYDGETDKRLEGADVYLVENGDTLDQMKTDSLGKFGFWVALGNVYDIGAAKITYQPNQKNVSTENLDAELPPVKIPLYRSDLVLKGKVVELKSQNPIPDAMVLLESQEREALDSMMSDQNGGFSFPIDYDMEYVLSAEKHAWFLVSEKRINTSLAVFDTSKLIYQDLQMTKLEMTRLDEGAVIKLENIYYDFDKYNIRPDAAEELDRIVKYLIKYPEMELELRSHTDSRGSDTYNKWLSEKRAESAVKYLIDKGAKLNQLTPKGYGESLLVNECSNGVKCSRAKHQDNRRTEFKVLKAPDALEIETEVIED
ncbi:MAG: OmpA family protein [Chitinophagales bacterium]